MTCQKCSTEINKDISNQTITIIVGDILQKVDAFYCEKCQTTNVILSYCEYNGEYPSEEDFYYSEQLNPKYPNFESLSIPKDFKEEFDTANELKFVNPRACVIYCRYILQKVMHQKYRISFDNIDKEIDNFIDKHTEMVYLEDLLKKFKRLANFAAHAKLVIKRNDIIENTEPSVLEIDPFDADYSIETMKMFLNIIYKKKEYTEDDIKLLTQKIVCSLNSKGEDYV